MKHLFNQYETMNDAGKRVATSTNIFTNIVIGEHPDHSLIELEAIIHQSISAHFTEARIRRARLKKAHECTSCGEPSTATYKKEPVCASCYAEVMEEE